MNIADEASTLLSSAGYVTRNAPTEHVAIEFEDEAIFGFVVVYQSVDDLLAGWQESQAAYIRSRVGRLRNAADKRSNMYAIFLTSGASHPDQASTISSIEENFVGSRKIVGTALTSRDLVRSALLPLLPLRVYLHITALDLERRLKTRLEGRPGLYDILSSARRPEDLVREVVAE